jgi:hypothetical protein
VHDGKEEKEVRQARWVGDDTRDKEREEMKEREKGDGSDYLTYEPYMTGLHQ